MFSFGTQIHIYVIISDLFGDEREKTSGVLNKWLSGELKLLKVYKVMKCGKIMHCHNKIGNYIQLY